MLRPANHPAHHLLWLPPLAFFCNNWGYSFQATTTGSGKGVELLGTNCQCRLPDALCAKKIGLRLPELNYNGQTANADSPTLPAPKRQIPDHLPASSPFRKPNWLGFFLVASFLLLCLAHLLVRLGAFLNTFCQSFSFPFRRLSRLSCWSSHWWYGVDGKKSCC